MKKKYLYSGSIILVFTLIYALSTGAYFSCVYRTSPYYDNVDIFFEGYFYLFNAIGILFASFFMKGHYTKKRMIIAYSFSLLSSLAATFLLFLPLSKPIFTMILFLIFILIGFIQGSYVFLLTLSLPRSNRCMGLGIAASLSVIINAAFSQIKGGTFVQSIYAVITYLIIAVIACGLLIFAYNRLYVPSETALEDTFGSSAHSPAWNQKAFICTCIFIALSWAIQSLGFYFPFNSSLILGISNESLRLTNILGLLLGGYLINRDKKIGAISCLIILATPMLYIFLQARAGISLLVFMLSYFFTGFLSIYRFGIISDMSDSLDSKGNPLVFYCTFGMIFGRLGEGSGALLGMKFASDPMVLITATCFILVIAIAFFIFHYISLFVPVPQVVQSYNDQKTSFKIKYDLSSREMDVLEFLLEDDSNADIAEKLFVSENTIRFHVSNILKKTGCKSRKEIVTLFYSK